MLVHEMNINDVGQLSKKDKAYLNNDPLLEQFIKYAFDYDQFREVLKTRKSFQTDRALLVNVLKDQYRDISCSDLTKNNIRLLESDNTFTIVTAHQPSLLTGPLYYIYKILSTINLCQQLDIDYPQYNFVPVFISGGEDHDFDEINHFHLFQKKIEWSSDQTGSVGQFDLSGLKNILEQTIDVLGPQSKSTTLLNQLSHLINECQDYGQFSFRLAHLLFDHLGLVILLMDETRLKNKFIPVLKAEILHQESKEYVTKTQSQLERNGFNSQAHCRDINVFYRHKGLRNRIEKLNDSFIVVDSDISFSENEIIAELENHPDRFSPNVIMRPLFQELILPNLAYVGGGGEISYWLERLSQFEHFRIPFPMLVRRTSALIMSQNHIRQSQKLGLSVQDLFLEKEALIKHYLNSSDAPDFSLQSFKDKMNEIFEELTGKVSEIDKTFVSTARSESVKSQKSIDYLESKLRKSVKQKEEVQLNRIKKIKTKLFPSGLQERHDNIFEYISVYGQEIIDELLPHCNPFDKTFKVFLMPDEPVQGS